MWGISSQPAETSTSVDKLSAENDEGYDPLYHSGRPIESATEMEGLNQLFSPGESPMTATSSVYGMPGSIGRQHPADGDTPSLVTYPLAAAGSTDGGGGESLMQQQQQQYDRIPGSVVHSAAAAITSSAQGLLQRSSSADQMTAMRSYHCRLCKQEFENKSDMQNHSKELHRKEEKSHKCLHCLKSFPTSQQLGQHSLVHSNLRKYPCAYCDKSFKQLSHVQQHQRIHTGERPYKCIVDGCSKAFRQLSSLQQHLKGHSLPLTKSFSHLQSASSSRGELAPGSKFKKETLPRPHDLTCQVCEKRCADDELFFQHIHKHHPDFWRVLSGGLPLSDFVSPSSSSSEMRSTKTKKFTCPVCGKRYAHETGYAKHLASHPSSSSTPSRDPGGGGGSSSSGTGQLYSCAVCRKMFTREVHLYRHLEMKTDPGHSASFAELKKKKGSSSSSSFVNSAYDPHPSCPSSSVDPDSSSKSLRTSSFLDYPTTMMRSSSYDHQCAGDAATEFLLQTAASRSRYRYGRDSSDAADVAFSSAAAMHLGGVSSSSTCLSPHSGSSTPDAFPYVRPFAGTGAFGGDVCGHRGDYDPGAAAAFRGYSFQFGGHMNQDFNHHHHHHHHHGRSPSYAAAQNFRGPTQPDPRHSYFPSAYAASSSSSQGGGSGCQGPLHGVISQPPFVHPSVETARFDSAGGVGGGGGGGLLDPYLQRNGFSDHEVATALHQLARSIPGFI